MLRFAVRDALALDPADTTPHDRLAPSREAHRNLTKLSQRKNVGPRASGNAFAAERDSPGPGIRTTKEVIGAAGDSCSGRQARISARPNRDLPLAGELGRSRAAFTRPDGLRDPTRPR